jgi:hypothetical protein
MVPVALLNHRDCVIKENYHLKVREFEFFLPKEFFLVPKISLPLLK